MGKIIKIFLGNKSLFLVLFILVLTQRAYTQFASTHYLPVSVSDTSWGLDSPVYRLTTISGTVNVVVRNAYTGIVLANLVVSPTASPEYISPYTSIGTNGINNQGIIMEGNGDFSVTGIGDPVISTMAFSWVSKGDSGLGTDFRVFAPSNNFRPLGSYGNYYSIIATENTEITLSGFLLGNGSFNLLKGQGYLFAAGTSNNEGDFMSGKITATKPIAILNETIQFLDGGKTLISHGGSDDGADMLVPTNIIGKEYIISKGGFLNSADPVNSSIKEYITIVAAFDGTEITVNGIPKATPLNAGDFMVLDGSDWSAQDLMQINTNKNVYVWHKTTNADGSQDGYVLVSPLSCNNPQKIAVIPKTNYNNSVTNIITKSGATVTVNGVLLTDYKSVNGFDIYRHTVESPRVQSIISTEALFCTTISYENEGATGATYGGWSRESQASIERVQYLQAETDPIFDTDGDGLSDFCFLRILSETENTYQWYLEGQPISGETKFYLIIKQNGNYSTKITTPSGCELTKAYIDNIPCAPYDCTGNGNTLDTDGDLIADVCDLDDDNDGILDTIECREDLASACKTSKTNLNCVEWKTIDPISSTALGSLILAEGTNNVTVKVNHSALNLNRFNIRDSSWNTDFYSDPNVPNIIKEPENRYLNIWTDELYEMVITFEKPVKNPVIVTSSINFETIFNEDIIVDYYGSDTAIIGKPVRSTLGCECSAIYSFNGVYSEIRFTLPSGDYQGTYSICYEDASCSDSDCDGILDHLDLDSDNDGISDLTEAGISSDTFDSDGNGVIDGKDFVDQNRNGLADALEAIYGTNNSITPSDTDADTLPDYKDLDADADGIPDTIEAFPTQRYTTNDGNVSDDDLDGDGIIGLFDANDASPGGFGGNFKKPQNTDNDLDNSDTLPDYLDTDSDGDGLTDREEGGSLVINVSYTDPNGSINDPILDLPDEVLGNNEVAYRETCIIPVLGIFEDQNVCSEYTLPTLENGNYYTEPEGTGILLNAGELITDSRIIYVYAETATGCSNEKSFRVNISPPISVPNPIITYMDCSNDENSGVVQVKIDPSQTKGGSGQYTRYDFLWDNNTSDSSDDVLLQSGPEPLYIDKSRSARTIIVRIYDHNGCIGAVSTHISSIIPITATVLEIGQELCYNDRNAFIRVNAQGGTAPYFASLSGFGEWNEGTSSQFIFDKLEGGKTYTVYIKDSKNCITELSVELDIPIKLSPDLIVDYYCDPNTASSKNKVTVNIDSSVEKEMIFILDGDEGSYQLSTIFENIATGSHTISILYKNGCIDQLPSFNIETVAPLELELDISTVNTIKAIASGGRKNYQYSFEGRPFSSENVFRISKSGNYALTVKDELGCELTKEITLNYLPIIIPNYFTPNGDGVNEGWKPRNLELYPNALICIYDRYGRLLKKLDYMQNWYGIYKKSNLPSGDYWYTLELNDLADNRTFVGHFTLFR